MKVSKIKLKNNIILIYLVLFFFNILFCFNDKHINAAVNVRYMVIPYIDINNTIFLTITTIITIICISALEKLKINREALLLLFRCGLFFVPIIYMSGDFNVGVSYAIIQCFLAFLIGSNYTGEKKHVIRILLISSIILAGEVFYTLIYNNLTVFSNNIKWYMVLPIGKSNYIACYLLPLYVIVSRYYEDNKKFLIIYTGIMFFAILGTASKLALVMVLAYLLYQFYIKRLKGKNLTKVNLARFTVEVFFVAICVFIIIVFNGNGISTIVSRFTSINIFESRLKVYSASMDYIFANPLLGRSAFTFFVFDTYKAHNLILESLIETGMIGTLLFGTVLINVYNNIARMKNKKDKYVIAGFFIMYLLQGLIEPNLFVSNSDTFFWIIIGIGGYSIKKEEKKNDKI